MGRHGHGNRLRRPVHSHGGFEVLVLVIVEGSLTGQRDRERSRCCLQAVLVPLAAPTAVVSIGGRPHGGTGARKNMVQRAL